MRCAPATVALAGILLAGCGLVIDVDPRPDAAPRLDAATARDASVPDDAGGRDAGRLDAGRDAGRGDAGPCGRAELCNGADDDCDGAIDEDYMLLSDPSRCGGCDNVCPSFTTARATCLGGTCGFECLPGWADCDGRPSNGCETDLLNDLAHCGACDTPCFMDMHGRLECRVGACAVADCGDGRADCNLEASDGCEASLFSTEHCGTCGVACMPGQICLAAGLCGSG